MGPSFRRAPPAMACRARAGRAMIRRTPTGYGGGLSKPAESQQSRCSNSDARGQELERITAGWKRNGARSRPAAGGGGGGGAYVTCSPCPAMSVWMGRTGFSAGSRVVPRHGTLGCTNTS